MTESSPTNPFLQRLIEQTVRSDIRQMSAYHVQDATGMLKLDAMENPYPWPGSQPGWPEALAEIEANRYPDPAASELTDSLRRVMNVPEQYDIVLGNGSDELIQLLIQLIAAEGARVIAPEPSFVMYRVLAETNRVDYQGVQLNDDFQLDMPAMLAAVSCEQPSVLFLACPNNPTGIRYVEDDIRQLATASNGLVIVDEAYMVFSDEDALPLLNEYPNVLIMRTLSKVGLAGLRLGVLIGLPQWICEVDKIRLPYNINVLTQVAANYALSNYPHLQSQAGAIRDMRENLTEQLMQLGSGQAFDQVWPSEANFILLRTQAGEARPLFEALKKQGVLIKCLAGGHPLLEDCLRLTVGSTEENKALLSALTEGLRVIR